MKEKTYYIYEVPGVKIGCTTNPEYRVKTEQGFTDYLILEKHNDIKIASERELELQKEKGYKVDHQPYFESVSRRIKSSSSIGSKMAKEKVGMFGFSTRKMKMKNAKAGRIGGLNGGKVMGAIRGSTVFVCEHCGKEITGYAGYSQHTKYKHKIENNT